MGNQKVFSQRDWCRKSVEEQITHFDTQNDVRLMQAPVFLDIQTQIFIATSIECKILKC